MTPKVNRTEIIPNQQRLHRAINSLLNRPFQNIPTHATPSRVRPTEDAKLKAPASSQSTDEPRRTTVLLEEHRPVRCRAFPTRAGMWTWMIWSRS